MLSRIADSLFWLSRYMERADGLLRATSTHYILSLDNMVMGDMTWRPVLEIFTTKGNEAIQQLERNTAGALHTLLTDVDNPNSLKVIITRARENARGAQDHITKEVWEEINALYHLINHSTISERQVEQDVIQMMQLFTQHSLLYTGVADVTMPRGLGWSFMNLGKLIERCFEIIVVVDKHYQRINYNLHEEKVIIQWKELLFSLSGYELHLKTYRGPDYNHNVLHQVLFNDDFPHSVLYSLARIEKYLKDIIAENQSPGNTDLIRCFGRLYSRIQYTDPKDINSGNLQSFLEGIRTEVLQFSNALGHNFFSYQ
ncbi:MAG: alpha-E domain-containing protein [Chitinophagaceae bacterium]|nr:alpha-E domain-containing protein [Chitinophagaceae bacterium]